MKFTANADSLVSAVTVALKGIATASRIPILSGILLKAHEGILEFRTTDLEIAISHKIAALIEEPGEIVVPGKVFSQIVKSLPSAPVSFSLEGKVLKITCERSSFQLNTMDAQDFESFPAIELSRSIELPPDQLRMMVDRVRKAASTDKNRAILNGILLSVENNKVRLVATDSYRLAVADSSVETSSLNEVFELIIPSHVFYDALSLCPDKERISIGETDNQVVFTFSNTVYVSRKIEGNFPNYKQLLPKESTTTVTLKSLELTEALKRVSVMAAQASPVKFTVDADTGTVTLFSTTPDQGGATEVIPADITGESVDIAFNYHYVQDGLMPGKDENDTVDLELQSALRPGIFKSYGAVDYLYLVMPVRMNS